MKLNWKNVVVTTIALAIFWQLTDWVIHGKVLLKEYEATANLWRPFDQMKGWAGLLGLLAGAFGFTAVYDMGFAGKGRDAALWYGAVFGFGVGVSMGLGTYSFQAITPKIAWGWALGNWAQCFAGAFVVWQTYEWLGGSKKRAPAKKKKK
jgi:hypothetical protein